MVHPPTDEQVCFTGNPLLCVEVRSSRHDDLVRRAATYARAGLPHHWVVDPAEPTLRAYVLDDGAYRQVGVVTDHGEVPGWPGVLVDLVALLADWAEGGAALLVDRGRGGPGRSGGGAMTLDDRDADRALDGERAAHLRRLTADTAARWGDDAVDPSADLYDDRGLPR